ncbi:MAG TPA: adenylosuccinate lyase family protein [Ktedonobacteraceae bacterium]|nr:adenylosuccinate lyase family protein [Ktedonobacteraceae bacterium]
MPVHLTDSLIYQNSWGTPELRALFDDVPRPRSWLEILAALAETQAEFGLIPLEAARNVATTCRTVELDAAFFEEVRQGFEATNHSTLGLIRALQWRCPGKSGEWLYYGATVQDITDTWTSLVLQQVRSIVRRELKAIETNLSQLATKHRDTVMAGRTHGQIGLPITFGFKAAIWALEVRRHCQRLSDLESRVNIGQLGGGVGSLSSLGMHALELQKSFMQKLGLNAPLISWTNARDSIAEWFNLLALIASTGDKIGQEVYNLQRTEIGEVSEGFVSGTVGSITMPHKRNPEISEHLGTLSRVIRHDASLINESLVHDHERDGRSWKAEWAVLAETSLAVGKLLALLHTLTENLVIHADRMQANLEATGGFVLSEAVMLALAERIGKQSAHTLVYETAMHAHTAGRGLKEAILDNPQICAYLSTQEIESLFDYRRHTGQCAAMVDQVLTELGRNNELT